MSKFKNYNYPDKNGYFGEYGGKFVPEVLRPALVELEEAFLKLKDSNEFKNTLRNDLKF